MWKEIATALTMFSDGRATEISISHVPLWCRWDKKHQSPNNWWIYYLPTVISRLLLIKLMDERNRTTLKHNVLQHNED